MGRLVRPALASLLLVLAACGGTIVDTAGDGTTTTGPAVEPLTLTCGEGLPFESTALEGPVGAEEAEGEANDLLRTVLDRPSTGEDPLPPTGWRTLVSSDDGTLFGAGDAPDLSIVQIWAKDDGLEAGPAGRCLPRPYREGAAVGRWALADPDAPPSGTDLRLAVSEINCASEPLADDRLQEPEVTETGDAVTITFWITDPEGEMQTCAAGPPVVVEVHLHGPLGERSLLDGGQFPPKVVVAGTTVASTTTTTTTATTIDPQVSTTVVTSGPTTTAPAPGPPPDDAEAATKAIEDAYRIAWDGSLTQAQRVARVERGWETAKAGSKVSRLYPDAVRSMRISVISVHYVNATFARVDFELGYEGAPAIGAQHGEAVFVDGLWKVSFETRCRVIRQTLVPCP
jgi:hypothetical protein